MQLRPILLNSRQRIKEINEKFNLKLTAEFTGSLFFKINDAEPFELEQLKQLQRNGAFYFFRHDAQRNETLIVPDEMRFSQLSERNGGRDLPLRLQEMIRARFDNSAPVWTVNHKTLDFNRGPLIMGILNVTPDSFSDGGRFYERDRAVERALQMEAEGALLIDIGGESTRPGAEPVPEEEELRRVIPVIEKLRSKSDVLISVDTYKSSIARAALKAGADIVNDISAAQFDDKMIEVVRDFDCPIIIMHIKGTPQNMQNNPYYEDVVEEVYHYFEERIERLERAGIGKIIIDPGIGFGKRLEDNLHLLRDLKDFTFLQRPILMGTSRKSFIGKILNKEVDERIYGSLATQILAVQNGANIVRVHDVQATQDALKILKAVQYFETD
ncbi:dihydropteroate synthase [Caldithrix abyssi DSM 13497]|uniref:Dihydropteroate synthase n=1 Tax=Caldithrix abyssi DSM 13497 TaxID=880073 RepID=H1XP02_CALAY|nr:dihydropteroate synthase [Caldithrix abyssi]EHO40994.1 dihydropteroate synthase [Caldithrix abyssi DSM 13497]